MYNKIKFNFLKFISEDNIAFFNETILAHTRHILLYDSSLLGMNRSTKLPDFYPNGMVDDERLNDWCRNNFESLFYYYEVLQFPDDHSAMAVFLRITMVSESDAFLLDLQYAERMVNIT